MIERSEEYDAGYANGYDNGKVKVHDELRAWRPGQHPEICECDLCVTARAIIEAAKGDKPPWSVVIP